MKKEHIKLFFSNPTAWQRLVLLSVLTMFLSHLSIRTDGSGFDVFTLVLGGLILAFVIGWSSFNGELDLLFLGRSLGIVITSFELHRVGYSLIYPEFLDEMGTAALQFKSLSLLLFFGFYAQCMAGRTIVAIILGLKGKLSFKIRFKLPRFRKTTINTQGLS